MSGGYLHGWVDADSEWVRVECNADGELFVDQAGLFENPPTEDEADKGPSSEWAFDHAANVAAHHAKYTDADSRAAIGDAMDDNGYLTRALNCSYEGFTNLAYWDLRLGAGDNYRITMNKLWSAKHLYIFSKTIGGTFVAFNIYVHNGTDWIRLISEDTIQGFMSLYLKNPPIEDSANTAPTSEWAFDHNANANAHHTPPTAGDFNHQDLASRGVDDHHAKYTDLEAQQANNLDGDLYHTIPGTHFKPTYPKTTSVSHWANGQIYVYDVDTDLFCPVLLPDGATVTAVKVDGNAGASSQTWTLNRVAQADQAETAMATATVQTEDTTITNPVIDNQDYLYVLNINGLDTNDIIYYVRIKYTL